MSLNLDLWQGAAEATPAFSWAKMVADTNQWSDIGFAVDEEGRVLVYDPDPEFERELIENAAERRVFSAAPIKKATKRYDRLFVRGQEMNVANLRIAEDLGSSVRCWLQMTDRYLLGSWPWGRLLDPESGNAGPSYDNWQESSGSGVALVWRWPLEQIERISVNRVKSMFKWWDEQISIYGPEGSFFRAGDVSDVFDSLPRAQAGSSSMLSFGEALGSLVASARGMARAPSWRIDRDGSDKGYELRFVPERTRPRRTDVPASGGGLAGFLARAGVEEGVSEDQAWRDLLSQR